MGHWYNKDGSPCYRIVGKNGVERDTTLADAKRGGLYYSVTEIIGTVSKPGLERWKLSQLLEAASSVEALLCDDQQDWTKQVWEKYNDSIGIFAKEGNEVHDKLEKYYVYGELNKSDEALLNPVLAKVEELCYTNDWSEIISEKSFASALGYGGKIDLILGDNEAILDFKTKKSDVVDKKNLRDDYVIQLAAYREAINPSAKCYNLIISTNVPGEMYLHEWPEDELKKGWNMFKLLLDFTKLSKNYDPSIVQ